MMRSIKFGAVLCVALLAVPPGQAETGDNTSASRVVERLNTALLEVMKSADTLGYQGRYERLSPVIQETHDLAYIVKFAVGRKNWEQLDDAQKNQLLEVFTEYSIGTYAKRFDGYGGESFRIESEKPSRRNRIQVLSFLTIPGNGAAGIKDAPAAAEEIDFNYVLRDHDGRWEIVNIIVQGVSDLALKRAQYHTILSQEGFEALVNHIAEKTAGYSANSS